MERFMIEVPHEEEPVACIRAVKILLESGSHFLTNADFGCRDGVHKAWIIVEAETKTEARNRLHRAFREKANIVQLNRFSLEELDQMMEYHKK